MLMNARVCKLQNWGVGGGEALIEKRRKGSMEKGRGVENEKNE